MFTFKTSFGEVKVEYDMNHHGQTVAVGYQLDGKALDLDDDVELIVDLEKEIYRIELTEWNNQFEKRGV